MVMVSATCTKSRIVGSVGLGLIISGAHPAVKETPASYLRLSRE